VRIKVKVCGITNLEDAEAAVDMGAWALGFNFFSNSQRFVSIKQATDIISRLPTSVEKVGVFVNSSADEIRVRGKMVGLTMIQLHGEEPPTICNQINTKKIIKTFRPAKPEDLSEIKLYKNIKYILIDGPIQSAGEAQHHNDWNLAKMAKARGSVILAGTLNPQNILSACREVHPFAVDVTAGIEARAGIKDLKKMKEFFDMVEKSELD
jgi:phosphoribosylanthranilate isomerase